MKNLFSLKGFGPFIVVMFINAMVDLGHKITIQNILIKSFEGDELVILTAIVNLLILLPFIGLFSISGFLNDKFSRTIITKYAASTAIAFTFIISIAYYFGLFYLAFFMTFLLAAQSAIYSPAKYGLIKTIVGESRLGAANGLVEAVTITSILLSSLLFSVIFEKFAGKLSSPELIMQSVWFIGVILFALSILETYFAFKIPYFKPSNQNSKFEFNKYIKFKYFKENINIVFKDKSILLCILGLSFFWAISQLVIAVFPAHYEAITGKNNVVTIQLILAVSVISIAAGAFFAGEKSKNHIEIGLVPFGAFGMFLSLVLFSSATSPFYMALCTAMFGFSGGIFIVPLSAKIQFFAEEKNLGKTLAGSNFIQNIFMVSFLMLTILLTSLNVSTKQIFITCSIVIFICGIYAIKSLPHLFARLLITPFFKLGYRISINDVTNIPKKGGVLLLGNHVSFIDWLIVQIASPRPIKFVMHRSFYDKWYLKWIFKIFKVIPIGVGSTKSALNSMKKYLENGEVVALFPEGHISYNGHLDTFQKGYELGVRNTGALIIPFYISGLWGSTFSRANIKKNIPGSRRHVGISFGKPLSDDTSVNKLRSEVVTLSYSALEKHLEDTRPAHYNWLKTAKADLFKESIVDSTGLKLNNLKLLTLVLVFVKQFKKVLKDDKNVGILLPSSVMGSAVNLTLSILGKINVNLNYTLSTKILEVSVNKAKIDHIITSKKFIEKLALKGFDLYFLENKFIYLEDESKNIKPITKKISFLQALLMPRVLIEEIYFSYVDINDEGFILFSSGSESTPKGIVLTHKNIMANIIQVYTLLNSDKNEVLLASLPIFHSFGLTITTLLPLSEGIKSVHVADPTDAKSVGVMTARYNATVIFGTSTFFRIYAKSRKLIPLMFKSVRVAVSGAEKLNERVKQEFKYKFGITIFEGYGTTETAPVISCNAPNILEPSSLRELVFSKDKSVGMPLPFTIVKIIDRNTYETLPDGEEGLIIIGGAQVMKSYYEDEGKTEQVMQIIDGIRYYNTGDIGYIDEDGFLFITDRLSRFAKIGGEMISLSAVEAELMKVLDDDDIIAITNVEDDKKGEKIVAFYTGEKDESEISKKISMSNLSSIMIPSIIKKVESIPTLGSGKVDFKGLKNLAIKFFHSIKK
ncbi:2-acylglycerophosphoethanolamine acyltransferase / acyl-acyl carrier protein synthetase [Campylobacter blaseri]|uniref:Acyl-[ACP]--phospholipid O-acyltransferase n=1 Tax=Campylobacter blaseri TaxID=2042961 RepID=A0A2P8R1A1_9BACT|nr:acyl-[ACP]--phospholipid O-acyltransferase [Campylobacter blaseri]PSM52258.1 acyl-[ACP]--phospholipid O-acyltransferase [Campylobacter blaseri]PSM54024.1 acyl-[ACP]--phospholipid O-acyltransferase [Campylobacter blaseri]QKF85462.1 2-acylglycerophosphoethanolamine acyltransferase / acyl-acyl carrier protein synthetase [Campylobacter blaseri]